MSSLRVLIEKYVTQMKELEGRIADTDTSWRLSWRLHAFSRKKDFPTNTNQIAPAKTGRIRKTDSPPVIP